jgi:hypothetical protein
MPHTKSNSPVLISRFPAEGWRFLLKHLYLLLLIPLLFIAYPLAIPGIPIKLDFPSLDTSDYASGKLWVWTEKGSLPALETISRFPIIGLWLALGFIGINSELISKFIVMVGFFIASFSFYFSFLLLFKGNTVTNNFGSDTKLKIAAIIGALLFAYNPWSFERIHHWYLWMGYAILPLFFISIIYAFKNPTNLKYIASSIFLWSFASTTPHMTVFYGLIFGTVFAAFLLNNIFTKIRKIKVVDITIKNKSTKNSTILLLLIPFLTIIILYALINAYWIYPIILASEIRSISPNYLMVEETLEFLSREANFLNTFRLVASWQEQSFEIPVEGTLLSYAWFFVSLALPIFGLSALVISRKFIKYTSIFSIFAIIGIILAMGTQSPVNYFKYVLENPLLSNYGWLVRDPDKWGFLIAFTYSFLIGIATYKILDRVGGIAWGTRADKTDRQGTILARLINKKKAFVSAFFLCLLIASIGLYSFPAYIFHMWGELRPIILPPEFENLNRYLSGVDASNVYFLPYPLDETKWNKMNRVGNIYQTHSLKPSIESSGSTGMAGMESTNYYNYFAKSVIDNRSKDIRNLIYPLGSTYLLFHNDTWDKRINSPDKKNLELLKGLNSLEGLENIRNIGFYNVFKVNNEDNNHKNASEERPQQVSILNNSIAAIGGLDTMLSLNSLQPSFSSLDSSVFFADQIDATDGIKDFLNNSDFLIFEKNPSHYDLLLSLVDDKYIIEPAKVAVDYDPMRMWSKSGAMDPDNGVFHPYLENRGIDNWQFDYGKGLVITQSTGANLSMPVNINETGQYDIILRFLKNQEGGMINVYLDNKLLGQINSLDERSNYFVWQQIVDDDYSPLNLKQGRHVLTLENIAGFNAVNLFGIVPVGQLANLQEKVSFIANKTNNVHILEAESSFYNNKGRPIIGNDDHTSTFSSRYYLFGADDFSGKNGTNHPKERSGTSNNFKPDTTFSGQIKVPENADLIKLSLLTKHQNGVYDRSNIPLVNLSNTNTAIGYFIDNLKIYPAKERQNIITLDLERNNESTSLAELRKGQWINRGQNTLSTSVETDNPISGNSSLRVDVRQGNASVWSMITTDHIPIKDKSYYNFLLNVSAIDVNQLHGRVTYYDKDRQKIGGDFISRERDGTFHDVYSASIVPPLGAKYLRFEILIKPITTDHTRYLIDDMRFEEMRPQVVSFDERIIDLEKMNKNFFSTVSTLSPIGTTNFPAILSDNSTVSSNTFVSDGFSANNQTEESKTNYSKLYGELPGADTNNKDNSTSPGIMIQETKPIPVIENSVYNFSFSLRGKQTEQATESTKSENVSIGNKVPPTVAVITHFTNSNDALENSTKYGRNASSGSVLTLSPGSEIYTDLDILKPANYTIALRVGGQNIERQINNNSSPINSKEPPSLTLRIVQKEPADDPHRNEIENNITNNAVVNRSVLKLDVDNQQSENKLGWIYLNNTFLERGKYEIRLGTNVHTDLDSVIVYPVDNNQNQTLDGLFDSGSKNLPANLADFKKINPTKYEVKIENATKPYMLSLVEAYDPLWMASYDAETSGNEKLDTDKTNELSDGNKHTLIPSIPLYSIVNGFYINKTGDYTLTIEYQPQKWFMQGAIISTVTAIALLIILFLSHNRRLVRIVKSRDSHANFYRK